MIKIDVSNVIPKRLGTYLLGIIPGLLFELSIAFGDPHLARQMIDRAKQIYPFQPYGLLILFVASCLVVGQTFFALSLPITRATNPTSSSVEGEKGGPERVLF
jgi:hypothetical protein